MLKIKDVESLDKNLLNINRRKTKKSQIILYDTHRRFDDYILKIKHRRNGGYKDIPHFIITKLGIIYQVFDTDYYSETFKDNNINKKSIKIALENLGWLNKNTITGVMNNWIGDVYRGIPMVSNWKMHFYWDIYTDLQMNSLSELCEHLCDKHKIKRQIVSNQNYMEKANKYEGVLCKSNFSDIYTHINHSFNFNTIFKNATQEI